MTILFSYENKCIARSDISVVPQLHSTVWVKNKAYKVVDLHYYVQPDDSVMCYLSDKQPNRDEYECESYQLPEQLPEELYSLFQRYAITYNHEDSMDIKRYAIDAVYSSFREFLIGNCK